ARSSRDWANMLTMLGHPQWSTRSRYQDMHGIAMEYPHEVDDLMQPWLMQRTREQILDLAQQHQLPIAPVRRIDELTQDEQFRFREFFETVVTDGVEHVLPGRPWVETESATAPAHLEDLPTMALPGRTN